MKIQKISNTLKIIFLYITFCGLVMFPCFIHEEAIQTTIFGTWPAKSSKDWNLVLTGCDTISKINLSLKIINYSVGWIQPLAFLSYKSFARGTDYYIKALKTEIFAKAPEAFDGRYVEFMFTPQKIIQENGQVILINRKIRVVVDEMPSGIKKMEVKGVIRVVGEIIYVERRKK